MEPLEQTATREQATRWPGANIGDPAEVENTPVSISVLGLVAPPAQRSHSALDLVSLILAVVIAPLGFVSGVVAATLSFRSRGYVNGLAKAAIVVSIVLSIVGSAGGVVVGVSLQRQAHEDALRSGSAAMCAALATKPGVLTDAAFAWPAVQSSIPAYVTAVSDYESWWTSVAKVAPAQMVPAIDKVVAAAHSASERMTASRVVDHDRDYSDMKAVAAASPLPTWTAKYCN